ncbi:MAG: PEP-CTERM sorting domain-containing protein [Isosphaeraceae bacterium]
MRGTGSRSSGWRLLLGLAVALGVATAVEARAGQVLDFSSATNAGVQFSGNGSSATFDFYNNNSGQGFQVTQTNGYASAVGLYGTIGGTFSYGSPITSTSTPAGTVQSAAVSGTGGAFTITDANNVQFSTTLTAVSLFTLGTVGNFDIQLTKAVYTGTNASLIALRNIINGNSQGAQAAISFSFVPGETLTQLLSGKNHTGYSGTLNPASVPEPSSLVLAGMSTVAMVGYTLRRRRIGRRA